MYHGAVRRNKNKSRSGNRSMKPFLILLVVLVLASGSFSYEWFITKPYVDQSTVKLGGYWSDVYPRWYGARELLIHDRDPYTQEITREIQIGFAGRPITDPTSDQEAFAYPLFVVVPLAPLVSLNFSVVKRLSAVVAWLAAILSSGLWAKALGVRLSKAQLALWTIAAVCSLPMSVGIILQQISLIALVVLGLALFFAGRRLLLLSGALLAFAWVKPQLSVLPTILLLTWAALHRGQRKMVWAFGLTLFVLWAIGEYLLPGWAFEWTHAVHSYTLYTGPSILRIIVGSRAAPILTGAMILIYGLIGVTAARRSTQINSEQMLLALSLALAIEVVILPNGPRGLYNQVMLLPVILALWKLRSQFRFSALRPLYVLAVLWLVVPALIALIVVIKATFVGSPRPPTYAPFNIQLFFPAVLVMLIVAFLLRLSAESFSLSEASRVG